LGGISDGFKRPTVTTTATIIKAMRGFHIFVIPDHSIGRECSITGSSSSFHQ
jgi:hypothetical protein